MALTAKKVYAILKRQISDMEAKLNSPVRYRGTVATADLLPLNPDIGDMYNIESKSVYGEAGMNVAWNGVVWDTMGAPIDMSLYLTKEEAETVMQRLVTEYFEKNPVKPGATTEQAQQIEQNKTDIASLKTETGSLKEDIDELSSSKIAKFYASSQGETHLADSDNGKIQDMMVYGKSEQKQYSGDNIYYMDYEDYSQTYNGARITSTKFGYSVSGTISGAGGYTLTNRYITLAPGTYKMLLKNISALKIGLSKRDYSVIATISEGKTDTTFTLDEETEVCLTIRYSNTTSNETNEIMLTKNLEATSYEPYVGGQPSPSPDYPQEIKSVVNPTVKVCGKNLYTYHDSISNFAGLKIIRDGSNITLDGTANANGPEDANKVLKNVFLKKGTYALSYNIESGSKTLVGDNLFRISSNRPLTTANAQVFITGTNNAVTFTVNEDTYASVICRVGSGSVYNNCKFNIQIEVGSTPTAYEPYHEQTVTLPYTLNAIPVESGGNVTIDGQQYIADYVDVERGKLVKMVGETDCGSFNYTYSGTFERFQTPIINDLYIDDFTNKKKPDLICSRYSSINLSNFNSGENGKRENNVVSYTSAKIIVFRNYAITDAEIFKQSMSGVRICYRMQTPTEIDLTPEEIAAFKSLATYYPITNISINSEQLDGYTVFNYPISMENGWNYVKQQIGDTRDYIYDMDARAQDTDLQAAEAYVNSEYAVALTELEV